MGSLEADFKNAVERLKRSTVPIGSEDKLELYGLYRQALQGDCQDTQPIEKDDVIGFQKWNVWNAKGGMEKEAAMEQYIELAVKLDPKIAHNRKPSVYRPKLEKAHKLSELPTLKPVSGRIPIMRVASTGPSEEARRRGSLRSWPNKSAMLKVDDKHISSISGINPITNSNDAPSRLQLHEKLQNFYSVVDIERLAQGIGDLVDWTLVYGEPLLNKELRQKYGMDLDSFEKELESRAKAEEESKEAQQEAKVKEAEALLNELSDKEKKDFAKLTKFMLVHDPELWDHGTVVLLKFLKAKGVEVLNERLFLKYGKTLNDFTVDQLNKKLKGVYGSDFDVGTNRRPKKQKSQMKNEAAAPEREKVNIADSVFFQENLMQFLSKNDPDRKQQVYQVMREFVRENGLHELNAKLMDRYGENLATFWNKGEQDEVEEEEHRYKLLEYVRLHEPQDIETAYKSMEVLLEEEGVQKLDERLYQKYGQYAFKPNNMMSIAGVSIRELHTDELPRNTYAMLELFYLKYDQQVVRNGGVPRLLGWARRNGYDALNRRLKQKYTESLSEFVESHSALKEDLFQYYAAEDPSKSMTNIDEIITWAVKNGRNALNEKLKEKYGRALDNDTDVKKKVF